MSKHALINWGRLAIAASLGLALGACGGGGGSGDTSTGAITLGITDAPVDTAEKVVITVTLIEIQERDGDRLSFDIEDQSIDLLALQGGLRELLLEDEQVPAGTYDWARLFIDTEPRQDNQGEWILPTYIQFRDPNEYVCLPVTDTTGPDVGAERCPMDIPSNENTGLKVNTPFVVEENGDIDMTIDFDLRKSVTDPQGQTVVLDGVEYDEFKLRPTLRLVMTGESGTIEGTVNEGLLTNPDCSDSDDGSVYVFAGGGVVPDDVDGIDPDPVTTADVEWDDGRQAYFYRAAYLEPGTYTVAFTCEEEDDESDVDESVSADPVDFEGAATVDVNAGSVTEHNFN